jgi:DNA invertase Pin-like site-specific DNA recombinase
MRISRSPHAREVVVAIYLKWWQPGPLHVNFYSRLRFAKFKTFDKNLAPMISRAYTRHKLWSKLTPKNASSAMAALAPTGRPLIASLSSFRAAGCSNRNIYREKVTDARADRRELNRMLGKLGPSDVVTVTRTNRLARSTFDLFAIVKRIADAKAQFRSLARPWADTGTSTGRLMLAVLGVLADLERDLIRTRSAEGRSRAKAQGKHMGRPPSLTPAQQKEASRRRAQGATLQELAKSYNVSRATISRLTAC